MITEVWEGKARYRLDIKVKAGRVDCEVAFECKSLASRDVD